MSGLVWILYEDSAIDVTQYGPHQLVLQCLCDRRAGQQPWQIDRRVKPRPMNSNSKVRRACQSELDHLVGGSGAVVAVYDDDKIHKLTGLPKDACKTRMKLKLREGCATTERLVIVLLQGNIEIVLRAIVKHEPAIGSAATIALAVDHKKRNERDRILKAAARPDRGHLRERILQEVRSFAYLIDKVDLLLGVEGR